MTPWPPLTRGTLVRRYKRFLADVTLDTGELVTAHCPNPGRMTSCQERGWPVWLSHSDNPKRKLAWTWELTQNPEGTYIAVNTQRHNGWVRTWLDDTARRPAWLPAGPVEAEVKTDDSRIDFRVGVGSERTWVEVKGVTLLDEPGWAAFPDAVSARAQRHVRTLWALAQRGEPAVLLFVVWRGDVEAVRPAWAVDPTYAKTLTAASSDIEVRALQGAVDLEGVRIQGELPVDLAIPQTAG